MDAGEAQKGELAGGRIRFYLPVAAQTTFASEELARTDFAVVSPVTFS